jgi:hypothetical protein
MPDSKSVEDTHQHLRDLQRKGRSFSSSRICRHRACVASGTLEERSIQHIKTSKDGFPRKLQEEDTGYHVQDLLQQETQDVAGLASAYGQA